MAETRKLAAILAADVAGYSRLAASDEERRRSDDRTGGVYRPAPEPKDHDCMTGATSNWPISKVKLQPSQPGPLDTRLADPT